MFIYPLVFFLVKCGNWKSLSRTAWINLNLNLYVFNYMRVQWTDKDLMIYFINVFMLKNCDIYVRLISKEKKGNKNLATRCDKET